MKSNNLKEVLLDNPSLIWYVKDQTNVTDMSILEHILNYGTWDELQEAIRILGMKQIALMYQILVDKPRTNLKPRVKHYFDLYFSHASGNTHQRAG